MEEIYNNIEQCELNEYVTKVLMSKMNYIEQLFFMAMLAFALYGFEKRERNMQTIGWLILLFNDDHESFDTDLDYFAKIFEENHGKWHIGIVLFRVFRNLDADIQRKVARRLSEQFPAA